MGDGLWKLRESIQEALDQIASSRSSLEIRSKAFETIERHLAGALSKQDDTEALDHFLALQYTFECNVPLRLLSWIPTATQQLDTFAKGLTTSSDSQPPESHKLELFILTDQLTQALSLIQGISLCHTASKDSLGRKYALEVLVDLLMASRHLPTVPNHSDRDPARKLKLSSLPLTSIVLDTLLCILVDSPSALRAFEAANGPQAVVRILKRAGTPREVRMKCLEFLYFYLLDETNPTTSAEECEPDPSPSPPQLPTAPATPIRPPKSYLGINGPPRRPPSSVYGSSTFSFPDSPASGQSSRSASGSSTLSFSSTSSNASSSTAASSVSSSPEKSSAGRLPSRSPRKPASRLPSEQSTISEPPEVSPSAAAATPFTNSKGQPFRFPAPAPAQPRMMMLKKEVEYEPMSPQKPQAPSPLGASQTRHQAKSKSMSNVLSIGVPPLERVKSRLGSAATVPDIGQPSERPSGSRHALGDVKDNVKRRTTEEKKELLGTMLGNVDALVEGVRKAGIWGLG